MVVRFRSSFQTCRSFDKYKTIFRRSGSRLVSCTLVSSTSSRSTGYFLPQFTQIASHLCHLSLEGAEAFLSFLKLPPGRLSSLETLSLKFFPKEKPLLPEISRAGEMHQYDPITLFENAPLLRRVNIATGTWDQWIDPRILPLQLPWDQLTHLLLSPDLHFRDSVLSSVLHRCTNLIQLRVPIPYRDQGTILLTSIDLRHLEALEIVQVPATGNTSPGQLLRHLVVPSLKRLIIMSRGGAFLPLGDISQI
ncbi:hypothetical protein BDZ94DRAFT_1266569 [Collybia nuda]|uniref:Uncharacterized protein n=1 Tax=Collybia nuda TaxID=64659 RepID=A0A9P5Y2F0_9AGAR|nr:hypothetical protein BDZ94DRAFT_1266569 [Collybia nuda]